MESSRHSVGMAVLAALATRLGVGDCWRGDKQVSAEVIVSQIQQTHVVLLRPKLLMNVNGVCVAKAGEVTVFLHQQRSLIVCHTLIEEGSSSVLKTLRVFFSSSPAGKYGIRPEDVLLVHDELDKPLGKIAVKHGGSARSGSFTLQSRSQWLCLDIKNGVILFCKYRM